MSHRRERAGRGDLQNLETLLRPSGGLEIYRRTRSRDAGSVGRYGVYRLLSLINSAIRERAADHRRSATRSETPNRCAVSAVEKPAK